MIYDESEHQLPELMRTNKNKGASEAFHQLERNHFSGRKNRRVKMNPLDRKELKARMSAFPNKNHTPVGFNAE